VVEALMEIWALMGRDLLKWIRNPATIVISLIQPLVWILIFGSSFNPFQLAPPELQGTLQSYLSSIFEGSPNYVTFLAPGIMSLTIFFSSMFGSMSLIQDRRFGYLNRLLVSPVSRFSILISKALASTIRGTVQAIIILLASIPVGLRMGDVGITDIALILASCIMLGIGFSLLYIILTIRARDWQTGSLINNLLSMPLFFTSSSLLPTRLFPAWIKPIADINPLTFASDSMRSLIIGGQPSPLTYQYLSYLALFDIVMLALVSLVGTRLLRE